MELHEVEKYLQALAPEGYKVTTKANQDWILFEVWPPASQKKDGDQDPNSILGENVRISQGISPVALGNMTATDQAWTNFLSNFFPWGAVNEAAKQKVASSLDRQRKKNEPEPEEEVLTDEDIARRVESQGMTPASQTNPNVSNRHEEEPTKHQKPEKTSIKTATANASESVQLPTAEPHDDRNLQTSEQKAMPMLNEAEQEPQRPQEKKDDVPSMTASGKYVTEEDRDMAGDAPKTNDTSRSQKNQKAGQQSGQQLGAETNFQSPRPDRRTEEEKSKTETPKPVSGSSNDSNPPANKPHSTTPAPANQSKDGSKEFGGSSTTSSNAGTLGKKSEDGNAKK